MDNRLQALLIYIAIVMAVYVQTRINGWPAVHEDTPRLGGFVSSNWLGNKR